MIHFLLIDCPDEPGLVYRVTEVLYRHGLNVLRNGEFVDRHDQHFFMRTEFDGPCEPEALLQELRAALPPTARVRLRNDQPRRIVLLATKEHHCLSELLVRHFFGQLHAEVLAVISNHDTLRAITEKLGVPYHHLSAEGLSREAHEAAVLTQIEFYQPEFVVLARYMRILSSEFVAHFPERLINIHHSFLPAFIGASPYAQAYERGVKSIGATAHFVTDQLDQGPIIAQSVIPTDHTQSARDMAQAGRDVEKLTLARALTLVFREQVAVHRNRTIVFE
ncbi:formyltetrahydrofolate deformylase [Hymenobacter perfusus]|uniref:Formyltetrahydrofolate deformylase n=1 Tax=Hymenobacter perfusus TaxID=1236770 RepID=A0A428KAM6_9BACT|nr:formyltetrahydrofolate deformylase [Hymenobacter perfusus]RSK43282.1 formyltetrahydrofolate deformylase [Hymenobacter perfusus]